MTGRLIILLLVLAALLVSYFGFVRELPGPSASPSTAAAPGTPGESPAGFEKPGPYPTEYDEVTVTIVIPPVSEFPPAWAEVDGCPHTRVSGALGAAIGPGNGCPVLKVEPDGPAAKAGIRQFDRLGEPSDCASTLYYRFKPRKEARTIEWTIRRPKTAESRGRAGTEAEQQSTSG